MAESRADLLAGGVVLAAAAGFLFHVAGATGFSASGSGYELRAAFRSVEGVKAGSDVRLAGIRIGSVAGMELDPATFMAELRLNIRSGIDLPSDSAVLVSSEGLLGGNYIEIIPGGALDNLAPGDEIEDTQGAVSLTALLMKFVGGAAEDALRGGE